MDHREYIDRYLSAHADRELDGIELQAVSTHLETCPPCRAELERERRLKLLLRQTLAPVPAPAALRARLVAQLDQTRPAQPRFLPWVAALALAAVGALVILRVDLLRRPPAAIDLAAAGYGQALHHFRPMLSAPTPLALAAKISKQAGLSLGLWDFSAAGFKLVGSRIEHQAVGRIVIYTLYRGPQGSILCMFTPRAGLLVPASSAPPNAAHRFVSARGLSFVITQAGPLLCVLVSRLSMAKMMEVVRRCS
ncbi:MAG TPA: anti-sigma factor [Candidatus Binataceae bacterium]|nr:anti-sigma factor [Candidatus Binataceae bacterium]